MPQSSKCYFERNNKIIIVNNHISLQTVINRYFLMTKELIEHKKENKKNNKNKNEKELIKNLNKLNSNNESTNISLKIVNNKKPSSLRIKNDKFDIKTFKSDLNGSDINRNDKPHKIVYPSMSKRERYNENKTNKTICPRIKNTQIRKAINSNNRIFKSISNNRLQKDKMKKKFIDGNKISIKNKFKNNLMNNYKIFDFRMNKSTNKIFPLT